MKITIVAVGRLKERFWVDAASEYLKRLSGYATIEISEVVDRDPARFGGDEPAREREAVDILRAIPSHAYCLLLAINGRERGSEDFSAHLEELMVAGQGHVVFVIGSSTGVAPSVVSRSDEQLSFGPITLPHNLARIVLLEQVYRAFRIMRNEPYHK